MLDMANIDKKKVLILVVVEDGLRAFIRVSRCLLSHASLNPCCCGRWSQRSSNLMMVLYRLFLVLILVVVEDGLRDLLSEIEKLNFVLILVVVEDGLRAKSRLHHKDYTPSWS